MTRSLPKVLMSAYACEPSKGSEPGVGWSVAIEMAKRYDVWVVTRSNNRESIERALQQTPCPRLRFVYHDVPRRWSWWKQGARGVQFYYYLWQWTVGDVFRRLHREEQFDLVHHVTFGRYWSFSRLAALDCPFVWGVVGGGESMPAAFCSQAPWRDQCFELLRRMARRLGECDPLVRRTARACTVGLAATDETAARLSHLGVQCVEVMPQCALTEELAAQLATLPWQSDVPTRFISLGRPLFWKGFDLGLRAFAELGDVEAEYWILANGVGRDRLESLTRRLGIQDRVRFFDPQSSLADVYHVLAQCHVLVHPALHEAFGNVVLEAMAAGRPVLALDIGGPAVQVVQGTGFRVSSQDPQTTVRDLSQRMRQCVEDPEATRKMGEAARHHVHSNMMWHRAADRLSRVYERALREKRNTLINRKGISAA
jgi:glycosyltransferase involved in cell wall biosynthesis